MTGTVIVGVGGYLLLFAAVAGLCRIGFETSVLVSAIVATSTVSVGMLVAVVGAVAGVGSTPEISGAAVLALLGMTLATTVIEDTPVPI